mgnify:CR=1 FL=1
MMNFSAYSYNTRIHERGELGTYPHEYLVKTWGVIKRGKYSIYRCLEENMSL